MAKKRKKNYNSKLDELMNDAQKRITALKQKGLEILGENDIRKAYVKLKAKGANKKDIERFKLMTNEKATKRRAYIEIVENGITNGDNNLVYQFDEKNTIRKRFNLHELNSQGKVTPLSKKLDDYIVKVSKEIMDRFNKDRVENGNHGGVSDVERYAYQYMKDTDRKARQRDSVNRLSKEEATEVDVDPATQKYYAERMNTSQFASDRNFNKAREVRDDRRVNTLISNYGGALSEEEKAMMYYIIQKENGWTRVSHPEKASEQQLKDMINLVRDESRNAERLKTAQEYYEKHRDKDGFIL